MPEGIEAEAERGGGKRSLAKRGNSSPCKLSLSLSAVKTYRTRQEAEALDSATVTVRQKRRMKRRRFRIVCKVGVQ